MDKIDVNIQNLSEVTYKKTSSIQIPLKGIHLNIQGISNKISKLELLTRNEKPHFLLITEHWMNSDQAEVTGLPGYSLHSHYCRSASIHGGSAIYGLNDITNIKAINIIKQFTSDFVCECSGVSVKYNSTKIAILAIYRSPNSEIDLFLNSLNSIICSILKSHEYLIIGGDFNINALEDSNSKRLLFDLFDNFNLTSNLPLEPTRDFNNCKSALDYVISNIPNALSINQDIGISDHKLQLFTMNIPNLSQSVNNKPVYVYKRNFTQQNLFNLYNLLSRTDLSHLYTAREPNQAWDIFWQNLLYCLDKTCPLIKVKISQTILKNYWVDANIIEESNALKNLYWLSKNSNDTNIKELYKLSKEAYAEKIKIKKKDYYHNKINDSSNIPKEIWNIVNTNTGRIKKPIEIGCINHNDKIISDKLEITNSFCKYYTENIEKLLNDTYGNLYGDCTVGTLCNSSLFFYDITPDEISNVLNNMQNKKSTGFDNISIKALKYISRFIIYPLCFIFNLSIKLGTFPDKLKYALIIPLHKKGDPELVENYRPITLLCCFSKLFEKIVQNRIMNFVNSFKLLSERQHGFRGEHSTNTAAYEFTNFIYNAIDKKELVLALFFDLTRAFDCVLANFLSKKIQALGIRGSLNKWIMSFLTNRKISVKLGNTISNTCNLNLGVPQGSVLSPLLFILFINDLELHISNELNIFLTMFADDTTICIAAKSVKMLETTSNNLLSSFYTWCSSNKLIINTSKTKYMIFHNKTTELQNVTLQLNTAKIEKVTITKFLGLHIDENLSWRTHIDHVISKLNSAYYVIRNVKSIMDVDYLLNIYYSLVYSHLKYLILYWGQSTDINRIFVQQKRILRLIYSYAPLESCRPLFKTNSILTVSSIFIYEASLFVKNNLELFHRHNSIHNYDTRSADNIYINNFRLSLYKKSALYTCSTIYNMLPKSIKDVNNHTKFKRELRSFLCSNCFYTLKEFYEFK